MVNVTINGITVSVPEGTTIKEAAAQTGIVIPTLCYLKDLNEIGACRVCCVEVEGERRMVTACNNPVREGMVVHTNSPRARETRSRMVTACNNPVREGMVVHTNSPRARETRRVNVELILSQHDCHCATCVRSGNCKLQELANDLGILVNPYEEDLPHGIHAMWTTLSQHDCHCATCVRSGNCKLQELANDLGILVNPYEEDLPHGIHAMWTTTFPLYRDAKKCIKCMRCVQVCEKMQSLGIWELTGSDLPHGIHAMWTTTFPLYRDAKKCIKCMRCVQVCEKMQSLGIWELTGSGGRSTIDVSYNRRIKDADCALCGQCITHCPVGALRERDDVQRAAAAQPSTYRIIAASRMPTVPCAANASPIARSVHCASVTTYSVRWTLWLTRIS